MRYILLGVHGKLGVQDRSSIADIEIQERGWDDLLSGRPATSLSDDLVSSLANLNLEAFTMEHAKKIKITAGLPGVGRAWVVVKAVCQWIGVKSAQQQFDAYTPDTLASGDNGQGNDEFGMYLKPPPKSAKPSSVYQELLAWAGGKDPVVWFGYLTHSQGAVRKSVFLYCRDEKSRDTLAGKLKATYKTLKVDRDEDECFVVVESPPEDQPSSDVEWFKAVFENAAKVAVTKRG